MVSGELKRVMICVPSGGSESTIFSLLITNVYERTKYSGIECTIQKVIAPYICRNRNDLVYAAKDWGATHIFFADNDMLLPEDAILRLLECPYDGVVCGNYVTKAVPARPMCIDFGNNYVYTTPKGPDYERVYKAPTGCMLVPMSVFERIESPFFHVPPRGCDMVNGGDKMVEFYRAVYDWDVINNSGGEDYWFCHMLSRSNVPIWVDHKLSLDISHLGSYPYSHVDAARSDDYTNKRFACAAGKDSLEYKRDG